LNVDALDQMLYYVDRLDQASLNLHPSAPIYRISMMLALMNQGVIEPDQKDQAIEEMQRYLDDANRRNPYNPENLFYEGMILEQKGDVQKATALWEEALSLDPSYLSARTKLMQYYQDDQNRLLELIEGGLPIRYWKQDPMQFYAIGLVFANETRNLELQEWIMGLMQRRMQLR
jgi:tetratricopeptide (TPR) repeat protein